MLTEPIKIDFHILKSIFLHEKTKLRKKSQYSSYVKFLQESISDVFRTIWALPWPLEKNSVFFHQFDFELFPLGEMAWHVSIKSEQLNHSFWLPLLDQS